MKLKTQLNLLATLITAIPLACIVFVCINYYLRTQKNTLLTGYEQVTKLDSSNMTDDDYKIFKRNVQLLPKTVETALVDNFTGLVITSSIKELPTNSIVSQWELYLIMGSNSDKYFYQFTTLKTATLDSIMITRVPRKKGAPTRNQILLNSCVLKKGSEKIPLSTKEYKVLEYLVKNAGTVLSPETIFNDVWKVQYGDITAVAVYIQRLRKKLEADPQNAKYIKTEFGKGYIFDKDLIIM